ncbi:hypothetical protein JCM10450v2_005826 [Rhodotorula kratochvilovae]
MCASVSPARTLSPDEPAFVRLFYEHPESTVRTFSDHYHVSLTDVPLNTSSSASLPEDEARAVAGSIVSPLIPPTAPLPVVCLPQLGTLLAYAGSTWLETQPFAQTAIQDLPPEQHTQLTTMVGLGQSACGSSKPSSRDSVVLAGASIDALITAASGLTSASVFRPFEGVGGAHKLTLDREIVHNSEVRGLLKVESGGGIDGVFARLEEETDRLSVQEVPACFLDDLHPRAQGMVAKAVTAALDIDGATVLLTFTNLHRFIPCLLVRLDGPGPSILPTLAVQHPDMRSSSPRPNNPYLLLLGQSAPLDATFLKTGDSFHLHLLAAGRRPEELRQMVIDHMLLSVPLRRLVAEIWPSPTGGSGVTGERSTGGEGGSGASGADVAPGDEGGQAGRRIAQVNITQEDSSGHLVAACEDVPYLQLAESLSKAFLPIPPTSLGLDEILSRRRVLPIGPAPRPAYDPLHPPSFLPQSNRQFIADPPVPALIMDRVPFAWGSSAGLQRGAVPSAPPLALKVSNADAAWQVRALEREAMLYETRGHELAQEGIAPRYFAAFRGAPYKEEAVVLLLERYGEKLADHWRDVSLEDSLAVYALLLRLHLLHLTHGDLKPFNVVKRAPGDLRLVDFARAEPHACSGPAACDELCEARYSLRIEGREEAARVEREVREAGRRAAGTAAAGAEGESGSGA